VTTASSKERIVIDIIILLIYLEGDVLIECFLSVLSSFGENKIQIK
jgi:hypothetical protein